MSDSGPGPHDHSPLLSSIIQPAEELTGIRLSWEYDIWGSHPRWAVEPSIPLIKDAIVPHLQQQLRASSGNLTHAEEIDLEFLAEGCFNKTYTATLPTSGGCQSYIVRVSLPVDSHYKTASEVATIKYLRARTSIPIPDVFAWDADEGNPMGFEWILMEKVAGLPLQDVWYPADGSGSVDWQVKQRVVEVIAESVAQMWRLRFTVGGSLYLPDGIDLPGLVENDDLTSSGGTSVTVGRIVSMEFFWENHHQLTDIERGPFHSSGPWLQSRLRFVIADADRILQHTNQTQGIQDAAPDTDEVEQATFMKETAERLLRQLPNFIPKFDNTRPELFTLSHSDFSANNILVDSSGFLVGAIDWECTNALPTWAACKIPYVLDSWNPRTKKPLPECYIAGPTGIYLEHLEAYEQTILRQLFLERMNEIEPSWTEEFKCQEGNRKRDFETAVAWVGDVSGFHNRGLRNWLNMLEGQGGSGAEKYYSLRSEE